MSYSIQILDGVVDIRLRGTINSMELREVADAARKIEEEAPTSPNRIVDLSLVDEFHLDFGAMGQLANLRQSAPLKNKVKSAIVASKPAQFGYARMYQMLNENPDVNLELFTDREKGLAWITSDAKS
jgi:hypothetical protein